jgi:hypothetical protein
MTAEVRLVLLVALAAQATTFQTSVPVASRATFEGHVAHLLTGVPLAKDTNADGEVNTSNQPASFAITTSDVPSTATILSATLYYGGTQNQINAGTPCTTSGTNPDTAIELTAPASSAAAITADACYCDDGGATSYDLWMCHADVTAIAQASGADGTWTVDKYTGVFSNGATDNASAALLIVYEDPSLQPRRVVVYDGLVTVYQSTSVLTLAGFDVDTPPGGNLTYYALEGDAGSTNDSVTVQGLPGALSLALTDGINPVNNLMNSTINTTTPPQTGVVGVDIDEFDITGALTAGDTSIKVTYTSNAGTGEKWWLAVNVVGVDQYAPILGDRSTKSGVLIDDADGDGYATEGDTVEYTIHLENSGNDVADVELTDPIPAEAASWVLVDDGGGTDVSTATLLDVQGITLAINASTDVVFDVVLGPVTDGATLDNTATWTLSPSGSDGDLVAPGIALANDADGDGFYDAEDCGPADLAVFPGATEVCNGTDDDCDGSTDESGAQGESTFYADVDGDGYGVTAVLACDQPAGTALVSGDCDDGAAAVNPGATEACNGVDDDCDGFTDEAGASGELTWYADIDLDGYGDPGSTQVACDQPAGTVPTAGDCDDASQITHPNATEVCDGSDNDCDGQIDENAVGTGSWWADADADGFGDPQSTPISSCARPAGTVGNDLDCDDTRVNVFPGAPETCDGRDDDCDGLIDEAGATGGPDFYADADGDGFGDASQSVSACTAPAGYVADDSDCWDGDDGVFPGASERANGVDDDCDGTVDEGTDAYDDDGDGYAEDGGDCDDADPGVNPPAIEACDGVDQDCDGVADEGTDCYDDDGDGLSEQDGDCDDGNDARSPDLVEINGNGIDDDCDGSVDGGSFDPDHDGYSSLGGDCDDTDGDVFPGAPERANGVDDDCDGDVDEGTEDADDDGDGASERGGDCDDTDPDIGLASPEVDANGVDDDCDGLVDEGGERTDDDGDGVTEEGGDCDDADPDVGIGAPEVANGEDDDCDGLVDEGVDDLDGDGVTEAEGDCDDANGWVSSERPEICGDDLDNDCDDAIDEDCDQQDTDVAPTSRGKCGCASGGSAGAWGLGVALMAVIARRRGSPGRWSLGEPRHR